MPLASARARGMGMRKAARGMSLVEVLVAAAVVSVGVLAALSAMAIGFDGIEAAHRSSVALFLAEERIEDHARSSQAVQPQTLFRDLGREGGGMGAVAIAALNRLVWDEPRVAAAAQALAGLRLAPATEAEVESALREFVRQALERDARSLAFLDEIRHAEPHAEVAG